MVGLHLPTHPIWILQRGPNALSLLFPLELPPFADLSSHCRKGVQNSAREEAWRQKVSPLKIFPFPLFHSCASLILLWSFHSHKGIPWLDMHDESRFTRKMFSICFFSRISSNWSSWHIVYCFCSSTLIVNNDWRLEVLPCGTGPLRAVLPQGFFIDWV